MISTTSFFALVATFAYLLAAARIAQGIATIPGDDGSSVPHDRLARRITLGGIVSHALALWPSLFTGPDPFAPDLAITLSLAGLITVAMFAVAADLRWMDQGAGMLVLSLTSFAPLVPVIWASPPAVTLSETTIHLHATISLAGYAILTLAVFQALVFSWQEFRIRNHRPSPALSSFASLETQERWLFQWVGLGFFLLSLSLISGLMFIDDILEQHLVHKTVLSCLAWAIFGTLLWGRRRYGWRGQQAVRWCLFGFAALVIAYFGSRLILEVLLDRRWYPA